MATRNSLMASILLLALRSLSMLLGWTNHHQGQVSSIVLLLHHVLACVGISIFYLGRSKSLVFIPQFACPFLPLSILLPLDRYIPPTQQNVPPSPSSVARSRQARSRALPAGDPQGGRTTAAARSAWTGFWSPSSMTGRAVVVVVTNRRRNTRWRSRNRMYEYVTPSRLARLETRSSRHFINHICDSGRQACSPITQLPSNHSRTAPCRR